MLEVAAYSTLAMTVGLVVARPRLVGGLRVTPALAALAGVTLLALLGLVGAGDLVGIAARMWRPVAAVCAIMVTTAVAEHAGLMTWMAERIDVATSARRLWVRVFVLAALTAAVLNNDSAVLLLTPAVIALARRRFPAQPRVVLAFAFAVFLAAGVAPLVVSNPMNMVVAMSSGIGFNRYAAAMIPVWALSGALTMAAALLCFARDLAGARAAEVTPARVALTRVQRELLALLLALLAAYPLLAYAGGPVWAVAAGGAAAALALAARHGAAPRRVLRGALSGQVVLFLLAVGVIGVGLEHAGVVERLASVYRGAGRAGVGAVSALGSALANNHPMSILNMIALEDAPARSALAALVGGDLGPRLLPMGSLAGLLWLELLRRQRVELSVLRFVVVGVVTGLPALAGALLLLG